MPERSFQVVCEVEPATRPDLTHVRHQVGVLAPVASAFLIPDNHIGRATVSSIAVAHEVALMGERAIACLNARDRNVLGFRRDLLTAAAYGVEDLLLVYGDRPETGSRSDDLTVRSMLAEAHRSSSEGGATFRLGVATGLRPLPVWKQRADHLYVQVGSPIDDLVSWRSSIDFDGPVFVGVMVLASAAMARRLTATIPQLAVPAAVVEQLERDPGCGVDLACDAVLEVRDSAAFAGVHLVPVSRYREVADRLGRLLATG